MGIQTIRIPGTRLWRRYHSNGSLMEQQTTTVADAQYWNENKFPDYERSRKPEGWLPPKVYSLDVTSKVCVTGEVHVAWNPWTQNNVYTGRLSDWINPMNLSNFPLADANQLARAETKALSKLKDQKVNLGVAFAEAQMTANLVGLTATRLANAYRALKRGQLHDVARFLGVTNPRKTAKGLPKHWLEWQYAWKPLLGDVHGAHLSLLTNPLHHWVVTVKGVEKEKWTREFNYSQGWSSHRLRQDCFRGRFVRLDYTPNKDHLAALAKLGVTNPFEIAWEIVPYSFVVDWFLPLGGWFHTFDAALGYNFLSGSHTDRRELIETITPMPHVDVKSAHFGGKARRFVLKRDVYAGTPWVRFPGFKNPLSLTHMANGLSLLATAFSGKGSTKRLYR